MIYLLLLYSFFKIGLFAFGGGYAMIPLMQTEIEAHGWVTAREFADIVAISQMTPGPIAVNAATFIGYRTAGIAGAAAATFGVSLPSFLIIILIAHFLGKFRQSRAVESVFTAIRPVTVGLIASAVFFFAELSILRHELGLDTIGRALSGGGPVQLRLPAVHPGGLAIAAVVLFGVLKWRLHPIAAVLLSLVLGIFLM